MPAAPAISVIIVAYNSGPTLERCLSALKAQTFTDYEVLLVDNAVPGTGDGAPQRAATADAAIQNVGGDARAAVTALLTDIDIRPGNARHNDVEA